MVSYSLLLALFAVGAFWSGTRCDFTLLLACFFGFWPIVFVFVLVLFLTVRIGLLDDSEIVLERQRDQVILDVVAHVEVLVHLLPNSILLVIAIVVITGLLGAFGGLHRLEEVEEGISLDRCRHRLGFTARLDLLLFLLFRWITALSPSNVGTDALFDDVGTCHHELLPELGAREVRILLENEDEVEAEAFLVQLQFDVLQVRQDGPILLADDMLHILMGEHGAQKET